MSNKNKDNKPQQDELSAKLRANLKRRKAPQTKPSKDKKDGKA